MQEQQKGRRVPIGMIAAVSAAVLAVGGGAAWWAWNSFSSSPTPSVPETSQATPSPSGEITNEETVQIYWLNASGNEIELVPSTLTLEESDQPSEILESAFQTLLAGPSEETYTTTIPEGTELRSVTLETDGIHVDLSEEFAMGGGSASMIGRVKQVIYTATSLDPTANVWLEIEGEQPEYLGGEGLILDQPMTRTSIDENFEL